MNKRRPGKMFLHTEKLRHLNPASLRAAVGGVYTATSAYCPTEACSAQCPGYTTNCETTINKGTQSQKCP